VDPKLRAFALFVAGIFFAVAVVLAFGWFGSGASVSDVLGTIALGLVLLAAAMFP